MTWSTSAQILTPQNSPNDWPILFFNTAVQIFQICGYPQPWANLPPPGVWSQLDFTILGLPPVNAVEVGGIYIITNGKNSYPYTDMAVAFQAHGAGTNPLEYDEQLLAMGGPTPGVVYGGFRGGHKVTVPCNDGHTIDWAWFRGIGNGIEWPDKPFLADPDGVNGASYGANLSIQAAYVPATVQPDNPPPPAPSPPPPPPDPPPPPPPPPSGH